MAALGTYVGTSELTELVPTEIIPQYVASYNYAPMVGRTVCWTVPGTGSIARRFPRWNAISSVPSGTKAESDQFTIVNIDTTESTITPGIVGLRLPISIEAEVQTVLASGINRAVLDECIRAVLDRQDADILSDSATNTAGAVTDNFTAAKFRAAAAAYRALNISPTAAGTACVLHQDGFRDLEESLGASAATLNPSETDKSMFGDTAGYHGPYHGFQVFSSSNVPADSSNWSGAMTPIGQGSGYGLVESQGLSVKMSEGDDAVSRLVKYYVIYAWYAAALTNPNNLLEVLHRT
jgi:hypothetical protein